MSSESCTTTLPSQLESNSIFTLALSISIMRLSNYFFLPRAIIMANNINSLVFVMHTVLVLCEVRAVMSLAITRRPLILRVRVYYQIILIGTIFTGAFAKL